MLDTLNSYAGTVHKTGKKIVRQVTDVFKNAYPLQLHPLNDEPTDKKIGHTVQLTIITDGKSTDGKSTEDKSAGGGDVITHITGESIEDVCETFRDKFLLKTLMKDKIKTVQLKLNNLNEDDLVQLYTKLREYTLPSKVNIYVSSNIDVINAVKQQISNIIKQLNPETPKSQPETTPVPNPNHLPVFFHPVSHIPFYQLSTQFHHEHIGNAFFHMRLRDRSAEYAGTAQTREAASEDNSIPIMTTLLTTPTDTDGTSKSPVPTRVDNRDLIYHLGRRQYTKHIGTWMDKMRVTVGVGSGISGFSKVIHSLTGGKRTRRHRVSTRFRSQRHPVRGVYRRSGHPYGLRHTRRNVARHTRRPQRGGRTTIHRALVRRGPRGMRSRSRRQRGGDGIIKSMMNSLMTAVFGEQTPLLQSLLGFGKGSDESTQESTQESTESGKESSKAPDTPEASTDEMTDAQKTTLKGSALNALVGASASIAIWMFTSVSASSHRHVWGNQIQDYIYYKGVHVGEPSQFYFETLQFEDRRKKFLVYYFKFELEEGLHPDNEPLRKAKTLNNAGDTTDSKDDEHPSAPIAYTHDFVPIVLQFRETRAGVGAQLFREGADVLTSIKDLFEKGKNAIKTEAKSQGGAPAEPTELTKPKPTNQLPSTQMKSNPFFTFFKDHLNINPNLGQFKNEPASAINSKLSQNLSTIEAPRQSHTDDPSTHDYSGEAYRRQIERFRRLNRLTQPNEILRQETVLHSLSTLNGRRLDVFDSNALADIILPSLFGEDSENKDNAMKIIDGLLKLMLSKFAGVGYTRTAQFGLLDLYNKFGSDGTNTNLLALFLNPLLRMCMPPIMVLFPMNFLDKLVSTSKDGPSEDNHSLQCTQKSGLSGISGFIYGIRFKCPNGIWTTKALPLKHIREEPDLKSVYVFFDQFSHNWCRLHDDTLCHFQFLQSSCDETGTHQGLPELVIAFELGQTFRTLSIKELLEKIKNEEPVKNNDPYGVQDIPFREQLRVMLFGQFHQGNIEMEMEISDHLMDYWTTETASTKTLFGLVNGGSGGDTLDAHIGHEQNTFGDYLEYIEQKNIEKKNIGKDNWAQAATYAAEKTKTKTATTTATTPDAKTPDAKTPDAKTKGGVTTGGGKSERTTEFSEFFDPVAEPPALRNERNLTAARIAYESDGTIENINRLRKETIRMLLLTMAHKLNRKGGTSSFEPAMTIGEFLNASYDDLAPHEYVIARIRCKDRSNGERHPFVIDYDTRERHHLGPFVIGSDKDMKTFFKEESFNVSVTDILRSIDKAMDNTIAKNKRIDYFDKDKSVRWLYTVSEYNTNRYTDNGLEVPESKEAKFKKCLKEYKTYLKSRETIARSAERHAAKQYLSAEKEWLHATTDQSLTHALSQSQEGVLPSVPLRGSYRRGLVRPNQPYWSTRAQQEEDDGVDIPRHRRNSLRQERSDDDRDAYDSEMDPLGNSEYDRQDSDWVDDWRQGRVNDAVYGDPRDGRRGGPATRAQRRLDRHTQKRREKLATRAARGTPDSESDSTTTRTRTPTRPKPGQPFRYEAESDDSEYDSHLENAYSDGIDPSDYDDPSESSGPPPLRRRSSRSRTSRSRTPRNPRTPRNSDTSDLTRTLLGRTSSRKRRASVSRSSSSSTTPSLRRTRSAFSIRSDGRRPLKRNRARNTARTARRPNKASSSKRKRRAQRPRIRKR